MDGGEIGPRGGGADSAPETTALAEAQVAEWLAFMRRRRELSTADADELEDHLRSRMIDLEEGGLQPDEAFLIAVKRMGDLDAVSREFAREHSDRLWKQLVLTGESGRSGESVDRQDVWVMIGCALAAALAIKLPAMFGVSLDDDPALHFRNFSLFALAPLATYFAWRRHVGQVTIGILVALFVIGLVGANGFPLDEDSSSVLLTALHLPIALWLGVGVAYAGGDWRSDRKRMDFIRFTGEWFIYYVLIALGGGVLIAFTIGTFEAIGIDAGGFVGSWLAPCGAMAAVVVAAWLVEAKQTVIENMAPVLTRVFAPLFVVTLVAFLVGVLMTDKGLDVDRDVLIMFDLLLVVILGLLLYSISARDPGERRGWFDWLLLALLATALLIDILVLIAILGRITEFGFSPNKTAALGENIILLANLAWSGWLLLGFVRRRNPFARLERWQTGYFLVYAVWAWTVVLVFPPVFHFA
ncbi:MAG: permease prefix domain 1-containing protein [Carbonactinosporaceae bacterium]